MAGKDWEELARKMVAALTKEGASAYILSPEKHPEFHRHFTELAQKSGLDFVPRMIVSDNIPMGPVWTQKLPYGGASPGGRYVLVNESMLKSTNTNFAERMTPEFETLMAHEFSHLKDGPLRYEIRFALPWAAPLLAVAGLGIYHEAKSRTKMKEAKTRKEYATQLTAHVQTVADEEIKQAHDDAKNNKWAFDPNWRTHHIKVSTYLLTAAIGLAAGLTGASAMSIMDEFRADKRMVKVTGKPEAAKRWMIDFAQQADKIMEATPREDLWGKGIKEKFSTILQFFIHAHPSNEQRFAYIDKVAESLARAR